MTWDSSLFEANSTNTVQIYYVNTTREDENVLQFDSNSNSVGYAFVNMTSDWLEGAASTQLTLNLLSIEPTDGYRKILSGPVITLTAKNSTDATQSSPSTSSSKKLGEKVGLPVGLVVAIAILIALGIFFCMRKRHGKGYLTGQSRGQRVGKQGTGGASHKRQVSFHDEPTRGVELQDRNKGLTGEDNWDWGSPVSSPTSARGSNAFRDEINRQRSGR